MINTCSPNKGLLCTVVILYYHRKWQAALLSQIYSHGTDRKENTLWTVSNNACIVVPCLVVTQQRSLLPLSKETATVYRVYSCMKNSIHMGEWSYSSTILDLGTRWRWVVRFIPKSFYSQGKSPQYPLNRRLGGLQSQSGCYGEEKNLFHLTGTKPWPSSP
jgi:hypothetical protein